jgi:hypothetical protein
MEKSGIEFFSIERKVMKEREVCDFYKCLCLYSTKDKILNALLKYTITTALLKNPPTKTEMVLNCL